MAMHVDPCRATDTRTHGLNSKLFENAKVLSNHVLIDPVAAVFDQTAEEYQPLRQALVSIPTL